MVFIDTCLKNRTYTDKELDWHYKNKQQLIDVGFRYDICNIADKTHEQLVHDLSKYEIMYVEGGNTPFLLQQSRMNGFGEYVRERVNGGLIYISTSAGSVIAGPGISANGRPGKTHKDFGVDDPSGFNLVNFVIFPHWGDDDKKSDYQKHKIPQSYQEDYPYILLTNNQYVEVVDDKYRIVDVTKV